MHKVQIQNDQIAGFGFDGQYFNLNVYTKLQDKMKLSKNVNFAWDPAHSLQLTDKNMRKSISWVDSICKDIGAVLSKFQFGKTLKLHLTWPTTLA